jgi:DNA-directed RNA polymerase specialized sigma24 family protein
VPSDVADDIVAEAFARVLAAIRSGGGPSQTFRGHLLTAVRNVANDWLRTRRRLTVVSDMDVEAGAPVAGHSRINPGIGSAAETQMKRATRRAWSPGPSAGCPRAGARFSGSWK